MSKPHGIIVFGASGSGTTTLGRELATRLNFTHLDTDDYFWQDSAVPFSIIRRREERMAKLLAAVEDCQWFVISGSICDWDEPFLPLFNLAVFVTAPTDIRLERLRKREWHHFGVRILEGGDMYENHREFIEWAAKYDAAGTDQRSRALHEEWMKKLSCPVIRVDGTRDVLETVMEISRYYGRKPRMNIHIRSAAEKDAAELRRLNVLFNGEENVSDEAIAHSIHMSGQEQVFVAEHGDRLVGFCCAQLLKSFCYGSHYVEITELFVEETCRRTGVASQLLAHAEKYYQDKNVGGFQLFTGGENVPAQRFYESQGYLRTKETLYRKR